MLLKKSHSIWSTRVRVGGATSAEERWSHPSDRRGLASSPPLAAMLAAVRASMAAARLSAAPKAAEETAADGKDDSLLELHPELAQFSGQGRGGGRTSIADMTGGAMQVGAPERRGSIRAEMQTRQLERTQALEEANQQWESKEAMRGGIGRGIATLQQAEEHSVSHEEKRIAPNAYLTEMISDSQRKAVLLPDSRFRNRWDVLMALLVIYTAVMVPIQLCYDDVETTMPQSMIFFEVFTDAIFLTDIYLNFRTAYVEHARVCVDLRLIHRRYLSRWFGIDLCGSFPGDTVFLFINLAENGNIFGGGSSQTSLLTLVKILKVPKLMLPSNPDPDPNPSPNANPSPNSNPQGAEADAARSALQVAREGRGREQRGRDPRAPPHHDPHQPLDRLLLVSALQGLRRVGRRRRPHGPTVDGAVPRHVLHDAHDGHGRRHRADQRHRVLARGRRRHPRRDDERHRLRLHRLVRRAARSRPRVHRPLIRGMPSSQSPTPFALSHAHAATSSSHRYAAQLSAESAMHKSKMTSIRRSLKTLQVQSPRLPCPSLARF